MLSPKLFPMSRFCSPYESQMGKLHIAVGTQKETGLKLLHQIVNYVEKFRIPSSLIINFGQTPSKYMQVLSMTMERGG